MIEATARAAQSSCQPAKCEFLVHGTNEDSYHTTICVSGWHRTTLATVAKSMRNFFSHMIKHLATLFCCIRLNLSECIS